MICEQWHVVVVPFPFTERAGEKRRPALVLSDRSFNRRGHTILAMITSAAHSRWPGDRPLEDLTSAGLRSPCLVRLKVFTLDNRLLVKKIGRLGPADRRAVGDRLQDHLPLHGPGTV